LQLISNFTIILQHSCSYYTHENVKKLCKEGKVTQFLKNNGRLEAIELIDTVKGIEEKRKFMKFVTDDPVEVGRYTLNGPVMLNIKQPHGVINYGPVLRAGISFIFKKDPWHLVED
jgi:hypothetical protein